MKKKDFDSFCNNHPEIVNLFDDDEMGALEELFYEVGVIVKYQDKLPAIESWNSYEKRIKNGSKKNIKKESR